MGIRRRLDRLAARTPAARGEEEVRAEACRRLSTEDLTVLAETCRRLEASGWDESAWDALAEEERAAFESAYGRYRHAEEEARVGR